MPLLQFMPWCPIDKPHTVGEITLLPFRRDQPTPGADELTTCQIRAVLASYKDLEGHPVSPACLVRYGDRSLLSELMDDEVEATRDWVSLACFSALAKRAYFNPVGPYCNADSFVLYGQKFSGEPSFTGITSRRREGRTIDARPLADTAFSIPVHASTIRRVSLDGDLLAALVAFQNDAPEEWGRWQSAIACFNQANTDNDAVSYQAEWVLLCGAFERILGAKPKAEDVAEEFAAKMAPADPTLASSAKRGSSKWSGSTTHLRHEWMKQFYGIRGDFAHGKLVTGRPGVWKPLEHLVLATIAFPLLVRCLLVQNGKCALTEDDQAGVDVFERLSDKEFLTPPPDQVGSHDSVLSRLVASAKTDAAWQKDLERPEDISH
jgi:hypothetical protein